MAGKASAAVEHAKEADRKFIRRFEPVDGKMKFYIHPKALELFQNLIGEQKLESVKVDPTSSPRTFFVDDFFVKLSLPQKINGAIRTIYPLQMQRATIVNDMFRKIDGFTFLPEPMAVYWENPDASFGFILRQRVGRAPNNSFACEIFCSCSKPRYRP